MSAIHAPVSLGEFLDKVAILEIKSERIGDPGKLENVRRELDLLRALWAERAESRQPVADMLAQLKAVNEALWEIEDAIRDKERSKTFDAEFIALARSVYQRNDERARIKRALNEALGSTLVEEKSYAGY